MPSYATSGGAPRDGREFVARLRSGDRDVFRWVRERCDRVAAHQFVAWAWDWIREDFSSDLIAQMLVAASGERFEIRGNVAAYVDTAARNLCRRYFRVVARLRAHEALDPTGDHTGAYGRVPDTLNQLAAALDVETALGAVAPPCRTMLVDKYLVGLSLEQMAARRGVPARTVRSRLHECREKLRRAWKKMATELRRPNLR